MLVRLGNVLYWGCSAGAAVWTIGLLYGFATSGLAGNPWGLVIGTWAIVAVPLWLVGRAARYVLSGR